MRVQLIIACVACLACLALPARADDKTGDRADLQQQLQDSQQDLQDRQAQQSALAAKVAGIRQDLATSTTGLSRQADMIRQNETKLTALQKSAGALSRQNTDLSADLRRKYGSISNLILAIARIRRMPPEALIARPGAPLRTAEAAMVLRDTLPTLAAQAEAMQAELDRLNNVRRDLLSTRDAADATGRTLQAQYLQMQAESEVRRALYLKTQTDYAQTQKDVARIAAQAGSLKDLLAQLAAREKQEAARRKANAAKPRQMPSQGTANLPVAGAVETQYGEKTKIGATSTGLTIGTAPNAAVTAPMGGIVKFAGPFRAYGQMVILAHADGYYSLLGGFGRIGVAVGQDVKAGQALGNMPSSGQKAGSGSSSAASPALYYELRHDGRAVDPSTKLKNLRS